MTETNRDSIWGEPIFTFTRRQAIEDGVLVQLSGPGYEGDDWVPRMCTDAGFNYPLAMTAEVFEDCVSPIDESRRLAPCQDVEGRLWDVLHMLAAAIRSSRGEGPVVHFALRVVPNVPAGYTKPHPPRLKLVRLKALCGPDDDRSPCITIMYPRQD